MWIAFAKIFSDFSSDSTRLPRSQAGLRFAQGYPADSVKEKIRPCWPEIIDQHTQLVSNLPFKVELGCFKTTGGDFEVLVYREICKLTRLKTC